jgi:glycerol-3-phosphate dehydrogenase (NAD+)
VVIVGSGNWGCAISIVIAENVKQYPNVFHQQINMWMYDEIWEGESLAAVFNRTHTNPKYLPGIDLSPNVVAITSVEEAVKGATLLVFVLPHQFVGSVAADIRGHVDPSCRVISLAKGLAYHRNATGKMEPVLISSLLEESLQLGSVSVLMGANIANEVATKTLAESTIGTLRLDATAERWKQLFDCNFFRVTAVADIAGVEISGALKNIVAIACGISDGLDYGLNTKAAIMRAGMAEMRQFARIFFPTSQESTLWESCGMADLVATCFGGRNRKCGEAFVRTGKSFAALEEELLKGQKLQGTVTAQEVVEVLNSQGCASQFPLFCAVFEVAFEGKPTSRIFDAIWGAPSQN